MRILLVSVYYLPSIKSSAKLIHDLAIGICKLGHEVIVLTADNEIKSDMDVSCRNGIKILRIKTGKIDGALKIVRAFNEMMLSSMLWWKGKKFFQKNMCDLVVWYSPSIFFGSLVKKLKKLFNCPSYLILRDIFPQWAIDTGILKKGFICWLFQKKEIEQYEAADVIGVQSPAGLQYFNRNGLDKRYRLEVLYNWANLKENNIPYGNYREQLGLKDKVVFLYGGNIGIAQDMDNIIRLAESLLDEPTAYFLLVGDGSEVKRLREIIKRKKLTNIAIHEAVDQQQYLAMLSEFDVGLISLDRKFKTQNFPGKMLGYMYYSMPILASVNLGNDLKDMLEDNHAGLICINGDDEQFCKNAIQLIRNSNLRRQLGLNARSLLESTFSVSRAAEQILAHFKN
jgi:glycosyltransferase involved in cell wall biosynthesis